MWITSLNFWLEIYWSVVWLSRIIDLPRIEYQIRSGKLTCAGCLNHWHPTSIADPVRNKVEAGKLFFRKFLTYLDNTPLFIHRIEQFSVFRGDNLALDLHGWCQFPTINGELVGHDAEIFNHLELGELDVDRIHRACPIVVSTWRAGLNSPGSRFWS